MLAPTSSSVCVMTLSSSAGVDETAKDPAFEICANGACELPARPSEVTR